MSNIQIQPRAYYSGAIMLRQYVGMIKRRKWIVIGSVLISMSLAWGYCLLAPKLYRSETLVLVEDQKIPETYVQGVVEANLEQRIFVIHKQVTSQKLLGEAVLAFDLYPEIHKKHGIDAAIGRLRDSIAVEMVGKERRGNFVGRSGIDAFTIAVTHEEPALAMKVTDWIRAKFIEANAKTREQTAESTTEFLDEEVKKAKLELEKREDAVRQFKALHMGELPQQTEANLRALDRLQVEGNAVNESTQRLSDRLSVVQHAIQDYQRSGKINAALASGPAEPDPLFRRLKELREKLIKLKAEFWDSYPEVLITKDELQEIEKELVETYGPDVLKRGEKPLDLYLQELKKQQSELVTELALLKQRNRLLQGEQKDYETRVAKAPQVEQELLVLERDYTNVKNNYTSLLEKRLNARVVENLEKRQKGAQFRIVDTANYPRVPVSPNERRILVFSFLIGSVMGVGFVLMRERLNPQFCHPEDVQSVLEPQLLAAIPDFMVEFSRINRLGHFSTAKLANVTNGHAPAAKLPALSWKRLVKQENTRPWQQLNFVAKWWPNSLTGEQYRVAATRLVSLHHGNKSTVIAVTSAIKGEGKTTTVINLGYTLARDLGKRTLLLECDFGRPMLDHYLEMGSKGGLTDALLTDMPLEDCLSEFPDAPCWIMPLGNQKASVSELLKSERFHHILAQCREDFDYVLINTPPILPLATMNMLEQHVDQLLLVLRASFTTESMVKQALSSLRASKPIHVILNAVDSQSIPKHMYDNYYEYAPRPEKMSSVT